MSQEAHTLNHSGIFNGLICELIRIRLPARVNTYLHPSIVMVFVMNKAFTGR